MKRHLNIIISSLLLLFFAQCNIPIIKEPERPIDVPKDARWVGGADGGSWYWIIEVLSSNTFRINVYNESSGDLEVGAIFTLNPDCLFKNIDSTTLVKSINGFDGKKILLSLPDKGKKCFLIPQ